jgi:MFS family permease
MTGVARTGEPPTGGPATGRAALAEPAIAARADRADWAVRAAWREPAYLRYLAGRSVSWLGDQVWSVALAWAAVRLASPGVAGLVLAASSVPRLALMLFGGPLADRHDARRLMLASDAARAVVTLIAAALAVAGTGLPLLVVVALVFGVVDAVFLPAAGSVQPRLLRPTQYASGAALGELANRAALTLGAPLGGLLVTFGGLPLGCLVDAATFLLSIAALWSIHPRPLTPPTPAPRPPPKPCPTRLVAGSPIWTRCGMG